jgi:hypothetical protein
MARFNTATAQSSAPKEPVSVTVKPVKDADAGVYVVTVKVDNSEAGSSVVRTSPKEFAYQS